MRRTLADGAIGPFVLIHGFSASPVIWSSVRQALSSHGAVIAVTLDGHAGGLPIASKAVSVSALADGVERDMDAAGIPGAVLVGNSLGGWLALELARRGRAKAVVALAPGGAWEFGSEEDRELQAHLIRNSKTVRRLLPALLVANRSSRLRRAMFAEMAVHGDRVPREIADTMLRASGTFTMGDALVASMFAPGNDLDAGGIDCPVLIGWGAEDKLTPAGVFGRRMRARLPRARWRELPDAGHIPMLDVPDAVASLILDFAREA